MKKLIAISFFICISSICYSQFGYTPNEIKALFKDIDCEITTGYSPNDVYYVNVISEREETRFYFNYENKCFQIGVNPLDEVTLKEMTNYFDLEYTKLRLNKWYKKSGQFYKTVEKFSSDGDVFFIKKLENKDTM